MKEIMHEKYVLIKMNDFIFLQLIFSFIVVTFPWLIDLFRVSIFPQKTLDFFSKLTFEIIEERRKTGKVNIYFILVQFSLSTMPFIREIFQSIKKFSDIYFVFYKGLCIFNVITLGEGEGECLAFHLISPKGGGVLSFDIVILFDTTKLFFSSFSNFFFASK